MATSSIKKRTEEIASNIGDPIPINDIDIVSTRPNNMDVKKIIDTESLQFRITPPDVVLKSTDGTVQITKTTPMTNQTLEFDLAAAGDIANIITLADQTFTCATLLDLTNAYASLPPIIMHVITFNCTGTGVLNFASIFNRRFTGTGTFLFINTFNTPYEYHMGFEDVGCEIQIRGIQPTAQSEFVFTHCGQVLASGFNLSSVGGTEWHFNETNGSVLPDAFPSTTGVRCKVQATGCSQVFLSASRSGASNPVDYCDITAETGSVVIPEYLGAHATLVKETGIIAYKGATMILAATGTARKTNV